MPQPMLVNRVSYKLGNYLWEVSQIEGTDDIYIIKKKMTVNVGVQGEASLYGYEMLDDVILSHSMVELKYYHGSYSDKYLEFFKSVKKTCLWDEFKSVVGELVDGHSKN